MAELAEQTRRKAPPPKVGPTPKRAGAYLTIAEMAAELGVATHVLRFWESKFPQLQPMKGQGGRRFYNAEAAAVARHVQTLLYQQKLTIKGAQAAMGKQTPKAVMARMATPAIPPAEMVQELRAILHTLEPQG